jgi:ABC-type transporter Mla subunit MlaD
LPAECKHDLLKPAKSPVPHAPFLSFSEIDAQLAALASDVRSARTPAANAGDRREFDQLLAWARTLNRQFRRAAERLDNWPGTAALIRDWLAHAPAPNRPALAGDGNDLASLQRRAVTLHAYLLQLIAALLQDSASAWSSELYRQLLDHPPPGADPALAPGVAGRQR